jgi:hypothetical protein
MIYEKGKSIHLVSNLDEEFFVEAINFSKINGRTYDKFLLKNYNGYSIRWPYVTFQSIKFKESTGQNLWILNANQQNLLHKANKFDNIVHEVELAYNPAYDLYGDEKYLCVPCTYIT